MIDLISLPTCPTCGSLAITFHMDLTDRKVEERNGIEVVKSGRVSSVTAHCTNYHYWKLEEL